MGEKLTMDHEATQLSADYTAMLKDMLGPDLWADLELLAALDGLPLQDYAKQVLHRHVNGHRSVVDAVYEIQKTTGVSLNDALV